MSVQTEDGVPQYNLKAMRGDTFIRSLSFVDESGTVIDITGWTIFFTAKNVLSEADAAAEVSVNVTSHTSPTGGLTQILASAAAMTIEPGDYFYDIQIKKADGTIFTILSGKLIVETDISVRTT